MQAIEQTIVEKQVVKVKIPKKDLYTDLLELINYTDIPIETRIYCVEELNKYMTLINECYAFIKRYMANYRKVHTDVEFCIFEERTKQTINRIDSQHPHFGFNLKHEKTKIPENVSKEFKYYLDGYRACKNCICSMTRYLNGIQENQVNQDSKY